VHAGAEDGYRPLSEAMVNIRATLQAAERAGVLSPEARHTLEQIAKGLFHADRSWHRLLKQGPEAGLDAAGLETCRRFVAERRVDAKRLDRLRLLHTLRAKLEAGLPPKQTRYPFSHTDSWEHIRRKAEATLPPRAEE
jgi:hypothetical protein